MLGGIKGEPVGDQSSFSLAPKDGAGTNRMRCYGYYHIVVLSDLSRGRLMYVAPYMT